MKTTYSTFAPDRRFLCAFIALSLALQGCAGPAGALVAVANVALEMSGIKKPELPDSQKPPRLVTLRIHAASNLNADAKGNGMAVVVRIYKLRGTSAFDQLNYLALQDPKQEKESLGQDLIESREVVLIPGQKYQIEEKVPYEAGFIGVAGLFRTPASGRWKYAFQSAPSEKTGLTLGAHACAFTVTQGTPIGIETDARLLSTTKCG